MHALLLPRVSQVQRSVSYNSLTPHTTPKFIEATPTLLTGPLGEEEGGGEGGREGGEERGRDTLLPNSPAITRVRLLLDHSLLC